MKIVFGIIGAVLGVMIYEEEGLVLGILFGVLGGSHLELRKRVAALETAQGSKGSTKYVASAESRLEDSTEHDATETVQQDIPEPTPTSQDTLVGSWTAPQPAAASNASATTSEDPTILYPQRSETDFADKAINHLKNYFTTGNIVAKVGVIVLFFGVAFLLKYSFERYEYPIELRLTAVAVGAIIMLLLGWRLRHRRTNYALILQGGAVGVLYLTVFAAARLYSVIPMGFAFLILFALVVLSCFLAVIQDSRALATFGTAGGFLAPVLTSTGQGNHIMLFSYYAFLNAGIFGIAWFKAWRSLNWVGFIFTFVIGALWGYEYYQPEHFLSTGPFLVLFFLFYVAISILFAHRQPPQLKGLVDGSLVFGVPLVAFGLQSALVKDYEFGHALSALGMGGIYLLLARLLWQREVEGMRMLTESFLALGIVFTSLAIPFTLDGHWTAAAWALEGAGLIWVGIRQQRLFTRSFGVLLQIGAGITFLNTAQRPLDAIPIFNSAFVGCAFISFGALFSSYYLQHHRDRLEQWEREFHLLLLVWGLIWWVAAGLMEIDYHAAEIYRINWSLLFFTGSLAMITVASRRLRWTTVAYLSMGLLPIMILAALLSFVYSPDTSPLARLGFTAWYFAFLAQYFVLWRSEEIWSMKFLDVWHAGTLCLAVFLLTWIADVSIGNAIPDAGVWQYTMWGAIPVVCIFMLLQVGQRMRWPMMRFENSYVGIGLTPIVAHLSLWMIIACFRQGDPRPLSYLPLLNPLEITQLIVIIAIAKWWWRARQYPLASDLPANAMMYTLAGAAFLWLNAVVARVVHFWGNVPYTPDAIFASNLFQTSISIVWTLAALSVMGIATRMEQRRLWFTGATLLGAVVMKLLLVDLAGTGTISRIVSFMAVGVLMLVIGYLAPVPPRMEEEPQA